jgi:hypothetical protein
MRTFLFSHGPQTLDGVYRRPHLGLIWPVVLLSLLASFGYVEAKAEQIQAKSSPTAIFGGKLRIALPKTARPPKRVSASLYSIQPRLQRHKFVIFATREPLRKDEIPKSNKALVSSIRQLLEAQGYVVLDISNQGSNFTVNLRAYTHAPWQSVGTTATRGTAKFVRTKDNQLVGSILLCDPTQWKTPAINVFKRAVSSAKVTNT